MVHEGLSQTADEIVDYDKVISNLLKMAVDLATMRDQHIDVDFVGKFGMMPAQDATPLSLVLTELITNSVEHGFEGRKEGHITISVGRGGNNLNVVGRMMAPAWRMRSMMAWLALPDQGLEHRSSTRSSPMILAERCIGSHVAVVVPVWCST